ncbi:agmatinase [candidate division KSB1 bacterium]|nr:agmatinase [candidate division KSB1 bacterium]
MTANPAFGAHLQPFAGLPSFMRQPATRELEGVDVAIVGIPYDGGTSHRSGTRFGPRKIREASLMLWGYHHTQQLAPLEVLRVVDYGDIDVSPVDIEATNTAITDEVSAVLKSGARVISLGGDHSIALPLLRAHAAQHGPLAVVHFDSHCDVGQPEFAGRPYSHGTPFRYALEEGLIDASAYLQIGIRGPSSRATYRSDAQALGARVITIDEAFELGMPDVIKEIHAHIGNRRVYVSLDIDAADPAFAPGTGTPEVGGFTSYQLLQLVRGLAGFDLIGFDLVEVSPPYDHGDITAILAANLAFEFLALLARKKIKNATP